VLTRRRFGFSGISVPNKDVATKRKRHRCGACKAQCPASRQRLHIL